MTVGMVSFTHCPLWVQVGPDIGMGLGQVVEVDYKGFTSNQARFLRM